MSSSKKKKVDNLSVAEQFYIEEHCTKMSLETICEQLNCDSDRISDFYTAAVDKRNSMSTIDTLMTVNHKRGYAIMTKEASEKGDATKSGKAAPLSEHIHKIRKDR
jgi:hypothetical protein